MLRNKQCGSGEMADALDLGSSGAIRGGSSPPSRTIYFRSSADASAELASFKKGLDYL